MSTTLQTKPLMTLEEFFAWDGGGHQGKLELVDGVVRAMVPASATHAIIQGNLVYAIGAHLRANGSPCRVAPEAPVRPALGTRNNARAPDVAVTCAPPSPSKTFDDPVLIIEDVYSIAVQVNGKLRGEVQVAATAGETEIRETAARDPKVAGWLQGKIIKKVVVIPKRLVNFVVAG